MPSFGVAVFLFMGLAFLTWGVLEHPWWAVTASVLSGLYAALGVLMIWLLPIVQARIHASGKLANTYRFQINQDGVRRSHEGGKDLAVSWDEIITVDMAGSFYFVMIKQGAMLLPFVHLSAAQDDKFKALCGDRLRSGKWDLSERKQKA